MSGWLAVPAFVVAGSARSTVSPAGVAPSQHDVERLLADHGIENNGIIRLGLAPALLAPAIERAVAVWSRQPP
ncbi:MAG TPA: hypothetical protein VMV46_23725, partial [Thermoanaerobaculia bacterium]|nr:hypothetical protein [Thermoanaerobaculia bacterium]